MSQKERAAKRETAKRYRLAHPDREKERKREWQARPEVKARRRAWMSEYKKKHRDKNRAQHHAEYNIPLKERCEICGAKAEDRHHPDYGKPHDVMHLCTKCHMAIHAKERQNEGL